MSRVVVSCERFVVEFWNVELRIYQGLRAMFATLARTGYGEFEREIARTLYRANTRSMIR